MTLKLSCIILSAARCDPLEKLWTTDTVLGSPVTTGSPGSREPGPGWCWRPGETSPGQGSSLQWADLAGGETSPASPRQLTRPGLPVRVHTLHDTSIPFLPPLGFTNHSPGRSDKQMQRETHAAPELHPRLFHSITPDPQSLHSTPEMK